MRKSKIIRWCVLCAVLCLTLLSGCAMLDMADLLVLPAVSPAHAQLIQEVNQVTQNSGWSTAAPVSGANRSVMQFIDFYGDGTAEAVVFFRNEKELNLRVIVYTKTGDTTYAEMCRVELHGAQFDRVDFVDFNADGHLEMVLGVQSASAAITTLSVYTIAGKTASAVLDRVKYTALLYYDITQNQRTDIVLLDTQYTAADAVNAESATAAIYTCSGTGESTAFVMTDRVDITPALARPARITVGYADYNQPAVVLEGAWTDSRGTGYVSDLLVYRNGSLKNITYIEAMHGSAMTRRDIALYCADIDNSGILQIPIPISMPTPSLAAGTEQYALHGHYITWYQYQNSTEGLTGKKNVTYYHPESGLMLLFPAAWHDRAFVRTEPDGAGLAVSFYIEQHGSVYALLTLRIYPDQNTYTAAKKTGETLLTAYGAWHITAVLPSAAEGGLADDCYFAGFSELRARLLFHQADGSYFRPGA